MSTLEWSKVTKADWNFLHCRWNFRRCPKNITTRTVDIGVSHLTSDSHGISIQNANTENDMHENWLCHCVMAEPSNPGSRPDWTKVIPLTFQLLKYWPSTIIWIFGRHSAVFKPRAIQKNAKRPFLYFHESLLVRGKRQMNRKDPLNEISNEAIEIWSHFRSHSNGENLAMISSNTNRSTSQKQRSLPNCLCWFAKRRLLLLNVTR